MRLLAALLAALLAFGGPSSAWAVDHAAPANAWAAHFQAHPAVVSALGASPGQIHTLSSLLSGGRADVGALSADPAAAADQMRLSILQMSQKSLTMVGKARDSAAITALGVNLSALTQLTPLVPQAAPLVNEAYKRNMEQLTALVKASGQGLIWDKARPGAWVEYFDANPDVALRLLLAHPDQIDAADRVLSSYNLTPGPSLTQAKPEEQAARLQKAADALIPGALHSLSILRPSIPDLRKSVLDLTDLGHFAYAAPQHLSAVADIHAHASGLLDDLHYRQFGRVDPPGWRTDAGETTGARRPLRRTWEIALARLGMETGKIAALRRYFKLGPDASKDVQHARALMTRMADLAAYAFTSPLNFEVTPRLRQVAIYAALIAPQLRSANAGKFLQDLITKDPAHGPLAGAIAAYALGSAAGGDSLLARSARDAADRHILKGLGAQLAYINRAGGLLDSPEALIARLVGAGMRRETARAEAARKAAEYVRHPYFSLLPPDAQARLRENAASFGADVSTSFKDTAVELELHNHPALFNALTTPDGTVGSLFPKRPLPAGFPAHPVKGAFDKARKISWDRLDPRDQLSLFEAVTANKKTDFFADRRIPGFSMKKRLMLRWDRETRFLGKTYPPGRHLVDVSKAFGKTHVEYMGPFAVKPFGGAELHFRTDDSAGTVSNEAWTLLEGLGIPRNHQHVHVVAPIPLEDLARDPEFEAGRLGEFYRRANLMAEMMSVVFHASQLKKNERTDENGDKVIIFGPLTVPALKGVTRYFRDIGLGKQRPLEDAYKIAFIGFWGSDKYDEPGLYGLEYRDILPTVEPVVTREILDRLQEAMTARDYGLDPAAFRRWLDAYGNGAPIPDVIGKTLHSRGWDELLASADPQVARFMTTKAKPHPDAAVRMLLNNWGRDPLFFDKPELSKKIAAEQVRALQNLAVGQPSSTVVAEFLGRSGLYDAVLGSLGIHDLERLKR